MTDRNDAPSGKRKKSAWPLIVGLPLIAVVAAAAIFFTTAGRDPGQAENAPPESAESPAPSGGEGAGEASGVGPPALGDEDAPVVMEEFSDYQ